MMIIIALISKDNFVRDEVWHNQKFVVNFHNEFRMFMFAHILESELNCAVKTTAAQKQRRQKM